MYGLQRRAGAKGFGLFACEDLQANQFIIEYIGEVSPSLQSLEVTLVAHLFVLLPCGIVHKVIMFSSLCVQHGFFDVPHGIGCMEKYGQFTVDHSASQHSRPQQKRA